MISKNENFLFYDNKCANGKIVRMAYLDPIIELNKTPDIKIVTGIHRAGKSKLIQDYIEYLISKSIKKMENDKKGF